MTMGVFLCASRHQIHVRTCVIIMEGVSVDAGAYQAERIVFTPHRLQLFLEPSPFSAVPCLRTPAYECTPTHGVLFECLLIYGV